ncbi:MAG TPA: hypothetical protein VFR09_09235 [Alphaproteobacteria bacterium]|nr:hypothetical protein [Alphaproteobacteria bacterium]
MNAWNVRSAMSANKKHLVVLATALALLPASVFAQGSAPAMFDVKEVVVQFARFENPKSADACGLVREELNTILMKALTDNSVPAIAVSDAKPPMMGVARIELVPEIASISNSTLDCTSYISLTAQSQNNVAVPPVDTPRSVTVVYWRKGVMAASDQSLHSKTVGDVLKKMVLDFSQRYRTDQPPVLPVSPPNK